LAAQRRAQRVRWSRGLCDPGSFDDIFHQLATVSRQFLYNDQLAIAQKVLVIETNDGGSLWGGSGNPKTDWVVIDVRPLAKLQETGRQQQLCEPDIPEHLALETFQTGAWRVCKEPKPTKIHLCPTITQHEVFIERRKANRQVPI
jgi:hypothetical protein